MSFAVRRQLEPPSKVIALASDDQEIAGAAAAELVQQMEWGIRVRVIPGLFQPAPS
jgi:hypothetical protein